MAFAKVPVALRWRSEAPLDCVRVPVPAALAWLRVSVPEFKVVPPE